MRVKDILLLAVVTLTLAYQCYGQVTKSEKVMAARLISLGTLTVTSYRPVPSQTDSSPTWTSIGDRTTKFGVAASQDMLRDGRIEYGDILYIPGYGFRVVNDCMAARHANSIDLLVFTHAEERRIGVRKILVYKVEGPK